MRLSEARASFETALQLYLKNAEPRVAEREITRLKGEGGSGTAVGAHDAVDQAPASQRPGPLVRAPLRHGAVVIAAITSCTNTSNPAVMIAAGLLARNAVARGLSTKPWVKTSLAPGSKVVTDYLNRAELTTPLETLGFNLVGYGCTTCIGNSGPLPEEVAKDIEEHDLVVAAVLSGNRNFEGRIHPAVRANYLTSPPLVVAYAIAGRMDVDLSSEPLGEGSDGRPVYLRDIWPSRASIEQAMAEPVSSDAFGEVYRDVFKGEERWASLQAPESDAFAWDEKSTYVKHPPYFEDMTRELPPSRPIVAARALAFLGDSITTDHISPAGSIKVNLAAVGRGSDYGSGSSRDWAAKGPMLLGVRAVIAKSYERIHRSNLVGMGILPLQFLDGDDADRLGLTGTESFDIEGIDAAVTRAAAGDSTVNVCARRSEGARIEFATRVRIDTLQEVHYYQHGGILKYVLRQLLARA